MLARDTAQSKNAKSQQARYKELFDKGLIPRDQYETQDATAAALEATLAADQSQVENARLNLQYTTIKAPISGRTGALAVHAGDLVRANDTAPLVDHQSGRAYLRILLGAWSLSSGDPARAGEAAAADPGPGQSGRCSWHAADGAASAGLRSAAGRRPARHLHPRAQASLVSEGGVVSFIDNSVDSDDWHHQAEGHVPNTDHALWPGLFVQVTLVLSTDPNAVVVPAAAVQASQAGQYVFVVKPDRTVEMRTVKVARQQGEEMVIAQGLTAGEEVVTDGHLRLTPGSRVSRPARAARVPGAPASGRRASGQAAQRREGGGGGGRRGREGNQS